MGVGGEWRNCWHIQSTVYNEIFKLYTIPKCNRVKPDVVLTEDTNSGYECYSHLFKDKCFSLGGKTYAATKVLDSSYRDKELLVIVDGAAFGADIREFMRSARRLEDKCSLYAPESFEYIILQSGIVSVDIKILDDTYDYADSKEYSSWERFFTSYLVDITRDTPLRYNKHKLNKNYLLQGNLNKIKAILPNIIE